MYFDELKLGMTVDNAPGCDVIYVGVGKVPGSGFLW